MSFISLKRHILPTRQSNFNLVLSHVVQQNTTKHLSNMKVIVTGVTGLVGSTVLKQCIKDSRITSVVALSRRELPAEISGDKKVKVIIHEDFSQYPDELLKEMNGAEACLW